MIGRDKTLWSHPDAGETTYTYDDLGNLLTLQTPNLKVNTIHYEYDGLQSSCFCNLPSISYS